MPEFCDIENYLLFSACSTFSSGEQTVFQVQHFGDVITFKFSIFIFSSHEQPAIERGESNISFDNIVRIADALEIPLKELFTFPMNDQPITEIERLRIEMAALLESKDYEKLRLSLLVLKAIFEEG